MASSGSAQVFASGSEGPVLRIIGIDTSGSAEGDLKRYRSFAYRLIRQLDPSTDRLKCYRFDTEAHEILSELGQRKMSLLNTLTAQVTPRASADGTRIAKFLEKVVEVIGSADASGRRVEIYILWDGGNDDKSPSMERLYVSSAKAIASNGKVSKIHFWGIKNKLREELPQELMSLGSDRLIVQSNTEEFANR